MPRKNPELIVKIGGNTKDFDSAIGNLSNTAKRGLTPLKIAAAGAAVSFAALAAGAAASVEEFKNFEREFSNVVTLLDEGSFKTKTMEEGIDGLRKGLIGLRATSGQSFDNLNKGLFDLISAGVDAEDAIDSLRVATDLALAGGTEASIAVDGLTTSINAFGEEAGTAQEISEKFFTAQKFGKTTIQALSTDIGKVAATAAEMGVSFDEVLASVSAATLAGINTNEAYTGLKAAFSNIIKPSKDAADEAKRLGINFDSTALNARGLAGFLDTITQSADFNSTSLEKLFGSMEAVNIILALTGSQAGNFEKILTELSDEQKRAGTFSDALAVKSETIDQKYKQLEGSAAALRAEIGERLSPAFGNFADNAVIAIDLVRLSLTDLDGAIETVSNSLAALALSQVEKLAGALDVDLGQVGDPFTEFDPDTAFLDAIKASSEDALKSAEKFLQGYEEIAQRTAKIDNEAITRAKEIAEKEAEINAEKAEKLAEANEARIEREDEQFEQDLERLNERLSGFNELENQFAGIRELRELQELKKLARTEKQKEDLKKATGKAIQNINAATTQNALENLQTLFGQETAVGKAIFFLRKAQAIADVIVSTQQAQALARATLPFPASEAVAARYAVAGALNVGIIGATAIQGAVDGTVVTRGITGKDTEPFLLAKNETVIPSKANPLSSDFDETFLGGLGGQQRVTVELDITEDASQIITAQQREDTALGIQR